VINANTTSAPRCRYRLVFRGRPHCGHRDLPPYLRAVTDAECGRCPHRSKDKKQQEAKNADTIHN
jgi:hypothetical protein